MEIVVSIADQSETLTLPDNITIKDLTKAVSDKTGKREKALSFSFGGKTLHDETKTLSQLGLKSGCEIKANVEPLPGLDILGPFALNTNLDVQYEWAGDSYVQMKGPAAYITELGKLTGERESFFQISPKNKVTLSDDVREHACIPLGDNIYFCWIYPFVKTKFSTKKKIGEMIERKDPRINLFIFGGFIYIDDKSKILRVNGVTLGEGLNFDGPYNMDPKCFEVVHAKGRFQEITIELEDCQTFCWFLPNEHKSIKELIGGVPPFTDEKGNEIEIGDGAFGYQCQNEKYRMFRVCNDA